MLSGYINYILNSPNVPNNFILFGTNWPLGQAVKTSPFHGGDTGSIPVGVIQFMAW